jgi:hypothetical protein
MNTIWDILTFKRMIAPTILQLLFWGAVCGVLYGTWVLWQMDNRAWPLPLIFGTLSVRLLFELAILQFRSYDRLGEIRDVLLR